MSARASWEHQPRWRRDCNSWAGDRSLSVPSQLAVVGVVIDDDGDTGFKSKKCFAASPRQGRIVAFLAIHCSVAMPKCGRVVGTADAASALQPLQVLTV